jgi:hypothetical protein
LLAVLVCCGRGENDALRLRATVIRPPKDTVRFGLPAVAHYCDDGRSLLLQAASPLGNGMLVRLRYGDSLTAAVYPIIAPGDIVATRGAMGAVRYMIRDVAHALAVDSGVVAVRRGRRELDARMEGWGLDGSIRTAVTVEYTKIPLAADAVQCGYQP